MTNTPTPPSASDALQKARELGTKRLCATKGEWFACDDRLEPVSDRGSEILYSHGQTGFESAIADGDIVEYSTIANEETDEIIEEVKKDDAEYIVALHNAFPFIHAELEKVTAERDVALKGYRGLREGLKLISRFFDNEKQTTEAKMAEDLLISFPEIK